jgi:hypothetical protein
LLRGDLICGELIYGELSLPLLDSTMSLTEESREWFANTKKLPTIAPRPRQRQASIELN